MSQSPGRVVELDLVWAECSGGKMGVILRSTEGSTLVCACIYMGHDNSYHTKK